MVERTSTGSAPCTLVETNDNNYARIKILRTLWGVYAGTPENSARRICGYFGVTGNLFRPISAHQINPPVVSVPDSAGTVMLETKPSRVYRKSDVSRQPAWTNSAG